MLDEGRLLLGFILIESKPHIFQLSLPGRPAYSGSLIPITEWISVGAPAPLSTGKIFSAHLKVFLQLCFKAQTQEGGKELQSEFTDVLSHWGWGGRVRVPGKERISLEQFRVGLIHPGDQQSLQRSERSLLQREMKFSAPSLTAIQAGVF